MIDEKTREQYRQAIELWSPEFQVMMLNEEMAELIIAVNKMMRLKSNNLNVIDEKRFDIVTEIANVKIMLEQMIVLFDISETQLGAEYKNKLQKMQRMIDEHTENTGNVKQDKTKEEK